MSRKWTPAASANHELGERWAHFKAIVGQWGCLKCREDHPCDCTCPYPLELDRALLHRFLHDHLKWFLVCEMPDCLVTWF